MIVYKDQNRFIEAEIKLEKQLEDDVVNNAKLLFGSDSIYIDAKRNLRVKVSVVVSQTDFFLIYQIKKILNSILLKLNLQNMIFMVIFFPNLQSYLVFSKSQIIRVTLLISSLEL